MSKGELAKLYIALSPIVALAIAAVAYQLWQIVKSDAVVAFNNWLESMELKSGGKHR